MYALGWAAPPAGVERSPGSCGLAVKIADGDGSRARTLATLEALDQLEALPAAAIALLRGRFVEDLRNHRGLRVGHVAAVFRLKSRDGAVRAVR